MFETILVKYFPVLGAIVVALVGFGEIKGQITSLESRTNFQYQVISEQLNKIDTRLNIIGNGK
jgi:hypothetical protein